MACRRHRALALKMLFVWRWRLGYWDWEAFKSVWRTQFKERTDGD